MAKRKYSKKQITKLFTQYGVHIWAILIIANAVMVYAYQFATHAATNTNQTPTPSVQVSPSVSQAQPSSAPAPLGPSINLTFTVPGIGSGGGVMKPLHPKRDVTVFLFAPDVNSLVSSVRPLYTIQGSATFDSNPLSPTYTSFIAPVFDLGSNVQDGNYQIAFRTNLSLRTLIKQNPTDFGGEIFSLSKNSGTTQIAPQTMLMGDIIPNQGDNVINISDYNAFIDCFGARNNTNPCKQKNYGDFNDDGLIDGVDYNILLSSLNFLIQQGQPVLRITPTPVNTKQIIKLIKPTVPVKKVTTKPASSAATTQSQGNGLAGVVLFLFIFIVLGASGFFLYLKNEKMRTLIQALIHLSPTGSPSAETSEANKETAEEQPTENTGTEETGLEKDYYVKKKGLDEAGTGTWLLLTDDNGPIEGHYAKNDVADGFAKVKGTMKTENGKTYLEVAEITPEG